VKAPVNTAPSGTAVPSTRTATADKPATSPALAKAPVATAPADKLATAPTTVKAPVNAAPAGKPAPSATTLQAPVKTSPPAPADTAPASKPPVRVMVPVPVHTPSKPSAVTPPGPVKTPVVTIPAATAPVTLEKTPVEQVAIPVVKAVSAPTEPSLTKISGAFGNVLPKGAPAAVDRVLDAATAPVASLVTAPAPLEKVAGLVVPRLDSTTALLGNVTAPLATLTAPLVTAPLVTAPLGTVTALLGNVTAPLVVSSAPLLTLGSFTAPTLQGLVEPSSSSIGAGPVADRRLAGAPGATSEAAPADRVATGSPSSGPTAPASSLPTSEVGQLVLAGSASALESSGSAATTMAVQATGPRGTAGLEPRRTAMRTTVPEAVLPRGPPTSTGVNPTGSTSQAHITPVSPPLFPEAPDDSPAGGSAHSTSFNSSTDVAVLAARLGAMALGPQQLRFSSELRQLLLFLSLLERPG
jgi:hypothetical protein